MSSLKALQDLIHEKYDIPMSELDPEASMRDKGLDSLALAEFIFAVEDHFHVVVPDDDPSIMSLGGLATVVDRLLAEKAAKGAATGNVTPAGIAATSDASDASDASATTRTTAPGADTADAAGADPKTSSHA